MDPLVIESAVIVVEVSLDRSDALGLKRVGPLVEDGHGGAAVLLRKPRVADAGIAGADQPEVTAVDREVGFERRLGAEEIERRAVDGELAVARGHQGLVAIDGIQLPAGVEIDYSGAIVCRPRLAAGEGLIELLDEGGVRDGVARRRISR